MPQVFKMGAYWIYFWTSEGKPLEPIHVHVSKGSPAANATKIWITGSGHCLICNNNSQIPAHTLRNIARTIETRSKDVIDLWKEYFGEISYYC